MTIQTIHVPHLGGITAAYQTAGPIDASKPTLVMVHSFMTTSSLFQTQFMNPDLAGLVNLVAIDLLGHGETRATSEHFTYWDSAIMNLQVMEKLGISSFFVLGTSQGGWVVARMALLAPEKVKAAVLLGTSMDFESPRSIALGCWDVLPIGDALVSGWSSATPTPDFAPDEAYCNTLIDLGLGPGCDPALRKFWTAKVIHSYAGDAGRRRARMSAINLRDRDGLYGRVADITCPVLWVHGDKDVVYSHRNAEGEVKLFTGSKDVTLKVIPGGQHFISASNPKETDPIVVEFLKKHV